MSSPWLTLRKLFGAWPRSPYEYFERAMEYAGEGQHEPAIDGVHEALRQSALQGDGAPNDSEAFQYFTNLAEIHAELGQHEEALAALDEVQRNYGDDYGSPDEERVQCLIELGDYERALALLEAYIDGDDYGPELNLARARCLAGLNRQDEARETFDMAICEAERDWGEADPCAYFHRGKFLLTAGDAKQAVVDFEQMLEAYDDEADGSEPALQAKLIEACRLCSEAHQVLGSAAAAEQAKSRHDELEEASRNYRPRTLRQIHKSLRLRAGIELVGPMIGISIIIWWLGPSVYGFLERPLSLPLLPQWWRAVPISMLTISIAAMLALIVARIRNQKPQQNDGGEYRRFEEFNNKRLHSP